MEVEVMVKVDGKLVKTHVQRVQGTLEQMEETIHALSKRVAGEALQATVEAVAGPRPFSKDGGKLRHRGYQSRTLRVIYQEMKCGSVFWQDAKERWHKQVVVGRDDPERFGLSLWQMAVACGMLQCPEVIFISDGGIWCNTVAELYFRDVIRILDWYHLSEHVWTAGRELYPLNKKEAKRWVHCCLGHLHDGGGVELLEHLERCRPFRDDKGKEAIDDLAEYVRKRTAITNYPSYRAEGYVIGSGMMESTCKQVVGQRLQGAGMQWSEEGALAMSHLVAHRLNKTWNRFRAGRPLQRAA